MPKYMEQQIGISHALSLLKNGGGGKYLNMDNKRRKCLQFIQLSASFSPLFYSQHALSALNALGQKCPKEMDFMKKGRDKQ